MNTLQSLCILGSGFLLSRLVLRAELHRLALVWLLRRTGGQTGRVVLGLMIGTYLLSTCVPNTLTVLSMMPVAAALLKRVEHDPEVDVRGLSSVLAMCLIYSAGVGGLASLLGSPTHLFLIGNLELFEVPQRASLHVVSWLAFGLPMTAALLVMLWGVLWLTERRVMRIELALPEAPEVDPRLLRATLTLGGLWVGAWLVLLVLGFALGGRTQPPGPAWVLRAAGRTLALNVFDVVGLIFSACYTGLLFLLPDPDGKGRLLRPADLSRGLPWKGLLLAAAVVGLLMLIRVTGVDQVVARWLSRSLPEGLPAWALMLLLVLVTIFATEFLNNTTVAVVMLPVANALAVETGGNPLATMLGVWLASTCAFMTPIATPVNAIVFAGTGHVSLKRFLRTGLIANLVAGAWIAFYASTAMPRVLSWFAG